MSEIPRVLGGPSVSRSVLLRGLTAVGSGRVGIPARRAADESVTVRVDCRVSAGASLSLWVSTQEVVQMCICVFSSPNRQITALTSFWA